MSDDNGVIARVIASPEARTLTIGEKESVFERSTSGDTQRILMYNRMA